MDANVIVYYCLPSAQTAAAERLVQADPDWRAPGLWRSELRNTLAGEMRRQGMSLAMAQMAMAKAEECVMRTHEPETAAVLSLAANSRCSAYDLEYVALAQQLRVPLVTADRELLRAFPETARALA